MPSLRNLRAKDSPGSSSPESHEPDAVLEWIPTWEDDPANSYRGAKAIVKAATHYDNPEILVEVSTGLGTPMLGQSSGEIPPEERLATRGW